MPKQLTVHNATIATAAVEIKTLTISGKQVTLAVFRQLREEALIAEDGTLNGIPWGYVNYHPDKCADHRPHRHYVWQGGDELLRSNIVRVPQFDFAYGREGASQSFSVEDADLVLNGRVREWLYGRRDTAPLIRRNEYSSAHKQERTLATRFGFTVEAIASDAALKAASKKVELDNSQESLDQAKARVANKPDSLDTPPWRRDDLTGYQNRVAENTAALAEAIAELDAEIGDVPQAELEAALAAVLQAEADRRQRHRDVREALDALPQLFIAV